MQPSPPTRPLRAYHALALVPVVAMLGGIPFANRAEPVLGLPLLLAWIVGWVVLTSATLALIYRLDEGARRRVASAEAEQREQDM